MSFKTRLLPLLVPLRSAGSSSKPAPRLLRVALPSRPRCRTFATHQDKPGNYDSLESAARKKVREEAFDGRESVGPFPLGVGPSGRRKAWRSWRELGLGGKLMRTTQQTGNLTVILIGGTLFVVLALSLTTELFAKNSPGVLYSQAVDMIRASDALNLHLLPPLSFTHTPHAASPIRGSPPLPHRIVRHPRSNRDHMLLTFWVHGRGKDEPEPLHWAKRGWHTMEEWGRWAGSYVGLSLPVRDAPPASGSSAEPAVAEESSGSGMMGRLLGGFSLRGAAAPKEVKRGLPPPGTYKVGEVHGDYVKGGSGGKGQAEAQNASGHFQLLSLVIDVPASSAPHPTRAVVFWSPEADSEGLLGGRR